MSFPKDSSTVIWVATYGSDIATGGVEDPYLTIAQAFSVVTATRKTVILLPGTYESAASIAWPTTITDVLLTGITPDYESTVIKCTAGTEAIDIAPATSVAASNFLAFMANLTVEHEDGIRGVTIDNTGMTTAGKKLIVTFREVGFSAETDTDNSVYWVHSAATTSLIKMYMHGRGLGGVNCEGLPYVDYRNTGDRCKCNGMNFEGGFQFGTQTIAAEGEFYSCIFKDDGGIGGQDTQIMAIINCISKTGTTFAVPVVGDVADNAAETIFPGS